MPRSSNPSQYPSEFADAVAVASLSGELEIPTMTPAALRRHMQAYLKALAPTNPEASDLMIRLSDKGIVICRRSLHPAAKDIRKALGAVMDIPAPSEIEANFLRSLEK